MEAFRGPKAAIAASRKRRIALKLGSFNPRRKCLGVFLAFFMFWKSPAVEEVMAKSVSTSKPKAAISRVNKKKTEEKKTSKKSKKQKSSSSLSVAVGTGTVIGLSAYLLQQGPDPAYEMAVEDADNTTTSEPPIDPEQIAKLDPIRKLIREQANKSVLAVLEREEQRSAEDATNRVTSWSAPDSAESLIDPSLRDIDDGSSVDIVETTAENGSADVSEGTVAIVEESNELTLEDSAQLLESRVETEVFSYDDLESTSISIVDEDASSDQAVVAKDLPQAELDTDQVSTTSLETATSNKVQETSSDEAVEALDLPEAQHTSDQAKEVKASVKIPGNHKDNANNTIEAAVETPSVPDDTSGDDHEDSTNDFAGEQLSVERVNDPQVASDPELAAGIEIESEAAVDGLNAVTSSNSASSSVPMSEEQQAEKKVSKSWLQRIFGKPSDEDISDKSYTTYSASAAGDSTLESIISSDTDDSDVPQLWKEGLETLHEETQEAEAAAELETDAPQLWQDETERLEGLEADESLSQSIESSPSQDDVVKKRAEPSLPTELDPEDVSSTNEVVSQEEPAVDTDKTTGVTMEDLENEIEVNEQDDSVVQTETVESTGVKSEAEDTIVDPVEINSDSFDVMHDEAVSDPSLALDETDDADSGTQATDGIALDDNALGETLATQHEGVNDIDTDDNLLSASTKEDAVNLDDTTVEAGGGTSSNSEVRDTAEPVQMDREDGSVNVEPTATTTGDSSNSSPSRKSMSFANPLLSRIRYGAAKDNKTVKLPESVEEKTAMQEKYAGLPLEERAYQILLDLGMVDDL